MALTLRHKTVETDRRSQEFPMTASSIVAFENHKASRSPVAKPAPLHLVETNINSSTGLATDYLNHFNEAIMLLEMLLEMPECREDFFAWQPMSYGQHFAASKFKDRELAIAAYEAAEPLRRDRLDALAQAMNEIIVATRQAMKLDLSTPTAHSIADLAVRWLKPLVARAGAVINGTDARDDVDPGPEGQAAVDALMAR